MVWDACSFRVRSEEYARAKRSVLGKNSNPNHLFNINISLLFFEERKQISF